MSEQPKDGATCRTHSDRHASFQCELCDRAYCTFCYLPIFDRCMACLEKDPTAAAPPLPFDTRSTGFFASFYATLATAFKPARSAPAFATGDPHSALLFFLLTALPLSVLSGIVPHTRPVMFGTLSGHVLDKSSSAEIAFDIAAAIAIQVLVHAAFVGGLMLPYVSLVKAYGKANAAAMAKRVMLYRAWLVPAANLLTILLLWLVPVEGEGEDPSTLVILGGNIIQILPVLLLLSMGYVARFAAGVGRGWAILLVTVALGISYCTSTMAAMILLSAAPPLGL